MDGMRSDETLVAITSSSSIESMESRIDCCHGMKSILKCRLAKELSTLAMVRSAGGLIGTGGRRSISSGLSSCK